MRKLSLIVCLLISMSISAQEHFKQMAPDSTYITQDSVLIKTRDGAFVSVIVARKKGIVTPQPCILQFSIYVRPADINTRCKDAVNHGYVGVVGYTRGKNLSPGEPRPYEFDGRDVYDVIDWITKQPWSNGKVGMYGGSYNGFTQ